MASYEKFALGAELKGHEGDVRAVAPFDHGAVTASRDHTVRAWAHSAADPCRYDCVKTMTGHQDFVSCVIRIPYTSTHAQPPPGCVVSGSKDKSIVVWDGASGDPINILQGHENNVCCLAFCQSTGVMVSGSWDKTARVWQGGVCTAVLKGHEGTVWAVLPLPDGSVLTGCADKLIRRWIGDKCVGVITGHTDVVRDLIEIPGLGFASASNDGSIRIWSLGGEPLQEMNGHSAYVYSIALLPTGEIASTSEDKTLKIWKDGQCVQTIPHPGVVWDVAVMDNGDIITGCSDRVARTWTRVSTRAAMGSQLKAFEDNLASQSISTRALGSTDTSKFPPKEEALSKPGREDGAIQAVRSSTGAEVYQWSAANQQWIKVGDVVDGPSGGAATDDSMGLEQSADYVFQIDMPDGSGTRNLAYNRGENPYKVAQDFIWKNNLDQQFLEQIARFITDNAGIDATAFSQQSNFVDPFTGGSRYIPDSTPSAARPSQPQGEAVYSSYMKELMASRDKPAAPKHVPKTGYTIFDSANYAGIFTKLQQFNNELASDPTNAALALSPEALRSVEFLGNRLRDTKNLEVAAFSSVELSALQNMLAWPVEKRFPGLDLLRMVALHANAVKQWAGSSIVPMVLEASTLGTATPNPACAMLALRFVANVCSREQGRALVSAHAEEVLNRCEGIHKSSNVNARLAFATVLLNFAVEKAGKDSGDIPIRTMHLALEALGTEADNEAIYRLLLTVGTLVAKDPAMKEVANTLGAKSAVVPKVSSSQANVAQCASEISSLL